MRTNWLDIGCMVGFITFLLMLLFMVSTHAADSPVTITITSISDVGPNLVVNASYYINNDSNQPYVGNVALKSFSCGLPSTESWNYLSTSSNGLVSFVINNRGLENYNNLSLYTEMNESNYVTWISPLDNTTIVDNITSTNNSTDVNISVNSSVNSTIPVVVVVNSTNVTVNVNTNSTGDGNTNVNVNSTGDTTVIINGKVTGGSNMNDYTGYKSFKTLPVNSNHNKALNGSNQDGVSMLNCGLPIDDFLLLCCVIIVFVLIIGRREGG